MKATRIIYWVTTAIIALMMLFSGYAYLTDPKINQGFTHLGFPGYFRVELAIAKFIAAVVLLAPVGARFKEWAYAGLAFTFVSAFIAHSASGDPASAKAMPLLFLAVLAVSYITYHKIQKAESAKPAVQS